MICPKCKYDNKPGAEFCSLCQEIVNRSAAMAHHNRVRRKQARDDALRVVKPTSALDVVVIAVTKIDFPLMGRFVKEFCKAQWREHRRLVIGLGLVVLGTVLYKGFLSPERRIHLTGVVLTHQITGAQTYLVGTNVSVRPWTERGERLDTPMTELEIQEAGTVSVAAANPATLTIAPKEWIRIQRAGKESTSGTIPPSHPSLNKLSLTVNKGRVQTHPNNPTARVGRLATFAFPKFPAGRVKLGDRWTEEVRWRENIGPWRVLWKGVLSWEALAYQKLHDTAGIALVYNAQLSPTLEEVPSWAQGLVGSPVFEGQGHGKAFYDARRHQLTSNSLVLNGTLTVPLADLSVVPRGERVGRRYALRGKSGVVNLKFESKTDVRQP